MRVLHIGPMSSVHTQIAAIGYKEIGFDATFLNTRKDLDFDSVPGVENAGRVINPWKGRRAIVPGARRGSSIASSVVELTAYAGRRDSALHHSLRSLARETDFDLVVGTWGVPVLEASLAAQRFFPRAAFVHNVLTVPELPLEGPGIRTALWKRYMAVFDYIKHRAYAKMLGGCDVRIHASRAMKDYLQKRGMLRGPGEDIIRLERFAGPWFPKRRLSRLSDSDGEPHVVHLGATNFSGMSVDNLKRPFERLTAAGIHVHFSGAAAAEPRRTDSQRFYHNFAKFEGSAISPRLAEFATQFDAAVILYNVEKPYDRFINALPTRFLFALVVGIPIVIPSGLFRSCEEYVARHNIGFSYDSESQLHDRLRDRERMTALSMSALEHASDLSLEDNLDEYRSIFDRALAVRRARRSTLPAVA